MNLSVLSRQSADSEVLPSSIGVVVDTEVISEEPCGDRGEGGERGMTPCEGGLDRSPCPRAWKHVTGYRLCE